MFKIIYQVWGKLLEKRGNSKKLGKLNYGALDYV